MFASNKYINNSSTACVLEIDVENSKELREQHNDYLLASDKIEIKKEMIPKYKLMISDFYNIPINNVKKLVLNIFDKGKYLLHYENLQLYLRLKLKLRKIHCILQSSYVEFNPKKENRSRKNNDKVGKALHNLMNNAVYGKQWPT